MSPSPAKCSTSPYAETKLPRRTVVLADDGDELLGLGGLGEGGEPAEVEVDHGDVGTVPREEVRAFVAGDERRDVG